VIEERVSRGATQVKIKHIFKIFIFKKYHNLQETIEHHTLPHKYKKLRRSSEADEDSEKCTICLSQFEIDNDVRYFRRNNIIFVLNNIY
jgi:hypothetical protein